MTIRDVIADNWDDLSERAQAWAVRSGRIDTDRWELIEEGYHYDTVRADSAEKALSIAESNVDPHSYDTTQGTVWIDVKVRNVVTGDIHESTVTLEPDEPDCEDGHDHDWQSPHSVLGGLKENPGVWGHGGGVIITDVCRHCGRYRVQDTWAQRPDTGEQGLHSTHYRDADDASDEWVRSMREEESDIDA